MAKGLLIDFMANGVHDRSGNLLASGKVYCYSASTTTAKSVYTDVDLTAAAANPVILDGEGKSTVYASGNYKFIIRDSSDTIIKTIDDVIYNDLTTVTAPMDITSTTTPQLELSYDANNDCDFSVSSGGDLTIAPSGSDMALTGNQTISGTLAVTGATTLSGGFSAPIDITSTTDPQFEISYDGSNDCDFSVSSGGSLTIAPSSSVTTITGALTTSGNMTVTGELAITGGAGQVSLTAHFTNNSGQTNSYYQKVGAWTHLSGQFVAAGTGDEIFTLDAGFFFALGTMVRRMPCIIYDAAPGAYVSGHITVTNGSGGDAGKVQAFFLDGTSLAASDIVFLDGVNFWNSLVS